MLSYKQQLNCVRGDGSQELEEVEAKLEQDEKGQSPWRRELGRICTPVFLEAFVLTFLAEWGDRSQIATISLAAQHDPCAPVNAGSRRVWILDPLANTLLSIAPKVKVACELHLTHPWVGRIRG